MTANGNALTNGADACHLISRDADSDFDIVARLDSLTGDGAERRAGIVVRTDLTPGAAGVAFVAVPGATEYAVSVLLRGAAGAAPTVVSAVTGVATGAPLWLRVVRSGLTVSAYYRAASAGEWTLVQAVVPPLGQAFKLGLAVSSADGAGAAEAVFGVWDASAYLGVAVKPTQDAYLRANNVNYGTATDLVVKRVTGDTQREVFLRFNVAGQTAARSAVLRLYLQARDANPAVQEVVLRKFPNLEWQETAVVWTNAPGGLRMPTIFLANDDPTIAARAFLPQAGQYVEFDVSAAVREAAAGTGDLTFNLYPTTVVNGNPANFSSKEHATAAWHPVLLLRYDAPPGVVADSGPEAGNITVAWQACPGAVLYRVYRADAVDGTYAQVGSDTAELRLKNTGLTAGQRYFYKVSAVTADGESPQSAAVSALAATASTVQIVSEDTYVNGGSSLSNNNYGTATALTVKYSAASTATHREAYLLFNDITGLAHVARAVLRVIPSIASPGDVTQIPLQFIRMPSNDWSEGTVTYMNYPPGFPPPTPRLTGLPAKDRVSAPCVAVGAVLEVDVTEIVREAARVNADNKLSIGIIRLDDATSFNCSLYSSEEATASRRPRLVYTLGRPQAPAAAVSNGYAAVSWLPYRGATGYVVRRAEAAEGPYTVMTNTVATAFKDLTAETGKTYYYTLAAVTAGGESESSPPAAASVQGVEERYPVADTYIDSYGSAANTNYGRNTALSLKRGPPREALFQFEVTGLEGVESAPRGAVPI